MNVRLNVIIIIIIMIMIIIIKQANDNKLIILRRQVFNDLFKVSMVAAGLIDKEAYYAITLELLS